MSILSSNKRILLKSFWYIRDWLIFINSLYEDTYKDIRLKVLYDRLNYERRSPSYDERVYILAYIKKLFKEGFIEEDILDDYEKFEDSYKGGALSLRIWLSTIISVVKQLGGITVDNMEVSVDSDEISVDNY